LMVERLSYDDRQKAAVRLECAICHALVYATKPFEPYECVRCRDQKDRVSRADPSGALNPQDPRVNRNGVRSDV
jgi:hypothetical protein